VTITSDALHRRRRVLSTDATEKGTVDMIKAERSIEIGCPIDEVFAYIADQRNALQWQSGVVEITRLTDGPPRVGTRHSFVRKFVGRRMEATNEYTVYEPLKRIGFKTTSGSVPVEASYLFESTGGGTKLTSLIELGPGGFPGLLEPLIARSLRRELKGNFAELKRRLEGGMAVAHGAP
jgi:uncharacterized membrane protein